MPQPPGASRLCGVLMFKYVCVVALSTLACLPATAQTGLPVNLLTPNPFVPIGFGHTVSLSGDTLAVSSPEEEATGAVRIYQWDGRIWGLQSTILPPKNTLGLAFGQSVLLRGDLLIVGCPVDSSPDFAKGSVYVYGRSGSSWTLQTRILGSSTTAFSGFGESLALSGDMLAVGAPGQDSSRGAVFVYTKNGTAWAEIMYIQASDGVGGDNFGRAVALEGSTLVVGAPTSSTLAADAGGAYIYTLGPAGATERTRLTPSIGSLPADEFGTSVAVSNGQVLVGVPGRNTSAGTVCTYREEEGNWSLFLEINADQPTYARYGSSLAASGDTLLIGSPSSSNDGFDRGLAYVSVFDGLAWKNQARLSFQPIDSTKMGVSVALDGNTAVVGGESNIPNRARVTLYSRLKNTWLLDPTSFEGNVNDDNLGYALAMSSKYVIVGAPLSDVAGLNSGDAYIAQRFGKTFNNVAEFQVGQAAGDQLGRAVDISDDFAIVGAPYNDTGAKTDRGAAFFIAHEPGSNDSWAGGTQLVASDGAAGDNFGQSVAVSGSIAVIGAPGDDTGAITNHGSVYVTDLFADPSNLTKITASDAAASDQFGCSCDIDANTMVIGALGRTSNQGIAYVYIRNAGVWTFKAKLTASDAAAGDQFGYSVSVKGDTIVVGAPTKGAGAAYVFARNADGSWSQKAKLVSPDAATGDRFGQSVDISGFWITVGASTDDSPGKTDAGAVYLYSSTTGLAAGPWVFERRYDSPTTGEQLGFDCATDGKTILTGAPKFSSAKGRIVAFDFCDADSTSVRNTTTSTAYTTLDSAISAATAGQSITAAAGAFDTASIDLGAKPLIVSSRSALSTNYNSLIMLSNGAQLAAAPDSQMQIFGSFYSSTNAGLVRLSAGSVAFGPASTVFIEPGTTFFSTPMAAFRGTTNFRSSASIANFTGTADFEGTLNIPAGAQISASNDINFGGSAKMVSTTLSAGGTVSFRTFTSMTSSTISADSIYIAPSGTFTGAGTVMANMTVAGKFIPTADLLLYGGLGAQSTSIIRTGTVGALFVFGPFVVEGGATIATFIQGCAACLSQPVSMQIGNTFSLDQGSHFSSGSTIELGAGFDSKITNPADFDMHAGTFRFNSAAASGVVTSRTLEVMSRNYGPAGAVTRPFVPGSFPLAGLELGPASTTLTLVDNRDNDLLGQTSAEALYVDTLIVPAGSRLFTAGKKIFARQSIISGWIDNPANIIPLPGPCDADLAIDSIVDDADFQVFLAAYSLIDCADPEMAAASRSLPGGCPADLNFDGVVDDADFSIFIVAYDRLLCP
ncbi:MAG: hypothetical protein U0573_14860 [Phycisphaerales bacterium]|nr:hypothetical protein [Planctomycetota bacterium]